VSSPLAKLAPAVAASALAVPHSRIRELAEIAMSMDGVLKLYFGESNLPTPEFIKRAAQKAMADGYTFYTENAGLPSLRKALARYYQELHAVEIDAASEIVVTASGVQALHLAIRCVLDPGDEALVLTPAWPNGAANIAMANAVPIEIAQPLVGDRYQIDFRLWKPQSRRERGCCFTPRPRIRWAGWRPLTSSVNCWNLRAATDCGSWPTKYTSA
jgi:aspartate aminotransferase